MFTSTFPCPPPGSTTPPPNGYACGTANAEIRTGFAVFVDSLRNSTTITNDNQAYLRTTAHELGHALNLLHRDGDGSETIMNQTGRLVMPRLGLGGGIIGGMETGKEKLCEINVDDLMRFQ